jgi:Methane oxygenase PmoA
MQPSPLNLLAGLGLLLLAPAILVAEVTVERTERGAAIKIDGNLFAEYLTKAGHSPAIWPIIGPTGKRMTRSFPLDSSQPNEKTDHPHHQSMWFTHGDVNGLDFWGANANQAPAGKENLQIVQRDLKEAKGEGGTARIVTRNDWMNGDKRVCEDERTMTFGSETNGDRWIDCKIIVKATDGDVTFGDTKEGAFGIRVPETMKVDAKQGGHIVNSTGQTDADAWGLPAEWVDYMGPADGQVEGETVGIAIFSHPSSFRPKCRWHVRTYGLFAANPFGEKDFNPADTKQGAVTIKQGDSLTLRYRVLFHRGTTEEARVAEAFRAFAGN